MRGVLEKIVQQKIQEVATLKQSVSLELLQRDPRLQAANLSMKSAILNGSGVIAEFKRASPSKGVIRPNALPEEISRSYQTAGASAISVLTDNQFFQGSNSDLLLVNKNTDVPVLRKDFTIDPYQIYEAKVIGADCILLIAAILSKEQIAEYILIAKDLGLEAIVEVHSSDELDKFSGKEEIIGVNNRNLDTFEVDIANSIKLSSMLGSTVKIAESGLGSDSNLDLLLEAGFDGFLVGESFMKEKDPGVACRNFVLRVTKK